MHEHPDTIDLIPPGTYLETVAHPNGSTSKTLELAIFKEHRFAFYFWNRWIQNLNESIRPPDLLTIDWHRDLAPPSKSEQEALNQLNLSDFDQVAKFAWSGLDTHNDGHLLSAAYLNLIGDIFLLKNYGREQATSYIDRFENIHTVHEFSSSEDLEKAVTSRDNTSFLLDIDLDFFIEEKVTSHQLDEVTPFSDDKIAAIINNDSPLFRHLYPNMTGITIATEPRYCGGILKSNHILDVVLSQLFTQKFEWKHLMPQK